MAPPDSLVYPAGQLVHGEERVGTPDVPELLTVLWEMGIYTDVRMFQGTLPTTVQTRDDGLRLLRHLLFVKPKTKEDLALRAALDDMLVETPYGLTIRGAAPGRKALILWKP